MAQGYRSVFPGEFVFFRNLFGCLSTVLAIKRYPVDPVARGGCQAPDCKCIVENATMQVP
jgi:hypothetical protein